MAAGVMEEVSGVDMAAYIIMGGITAGTTITITAAGLMKETREAGMTAGLMKETREAGMAAGITEAIMADGGKR